MLIVGVREPRPFLEAHVITMSLLALIAWRMAARRMRECDAPDEVTSEEFRRGAAQTFLAQGPAQANQRVDQVLLSIFVPSAALGGYSQSVKWSALSDPLYRGLSSVCFPAISSRTGEAALKRALTVTRLVFSAAYLIAPVGAVLTYAMWQPVFGGEFASVRWLAVTMFFAATVLGINSVLADVLRGLGRPDVVLRAEVAALVVTTAGLAALVGLIGVTGAAITSIAAYLVVMYLYLHRIAQMADTSPIHLLTPVHPRDGIAALSLSRSDEPEIAPSDEVMADPVA